jgi:hypothetical protein
MLLGAWGLVNFRYTLCTFVYTFIKIVLHFYCVGTRTSSSGLASGFQVGLLGHLNTVENPTQPLRVFWKVVGSSMMLEGIEKDPPLSSKATISLSTIEPGRSRSQARGTWPSNY